MALDFLILYEHTVREYESDLLLKLELERRGYTVRIRQLLDAKDLLPVWQRQAGSSGCQLHV